MCCFCGQNIQLDQDPYQGQNPSGYFNLFFFKQLACLTHTMSFFDFFFISNIYTARDLYIAFHKLLSSSVICLNPDTKTRTLCRYFWLFS